MADEDIQKTEDGEPKTEVTKETNAQATEATVEEVIKPADEKSEEKASAKPAPSGKFKDLIKQIEELSALELSELVKALEERFGVSAAAPMMMAAGAAPAAGAPAEAAEEKTHYTVVLTETGAQKIAVIKAIREVLPDLGLKEAKDLVDAAPKTVKENLPKADAEAAKQKIEAAGGKVELK